MVKARKKRFYPHADSVGVASGLWFDHVYNFQMALTKAGLTDKGKKSCRGALKKLMSKVTLRKVSGRPHSNRRRRQVYELLGENCEIVWGLKNAAGRVHEGSK